MRALLVSGLLLVIAFAVAISGIQTSTTSHAKKGNSRPFPTAHELRERACKFDPEICLIEQGKLPRTVNTVPKQLRGAYEGVMEWAIETAAEEFYGTAPDSYITQKLLAERKKDPVNFWTSMMGMLEQSHPEVAKKYKSMIMGEVTEEDLLAPPYWGFVPALKGHALLNKTLSFKSGCNADVTVSAKHVKNIDPLTDVVEVTAVTSGEYLLCEDRLSFSLGPHVQHIDLKTSGTYTVPVNAADAALSKAWEWDLHEKGIRVFEFDKPSEFRTLDIIATLLLFTPLITNQKIEGLPAKWNVDYLSNYTKIQPYPVPRPPVSPNMTKRSHVLKLTPGVDVFEGDCFAKMDLNGLGTSEMLGQGTTSGHVSFALNNRTTGELVVCESVTQGIICTPYGEWVNNMDDQGLNIVMVPLSKELRDSFNSTAAWEFLDGVLGNEYGYHNFIFGWIDTREHNYPCFPNDFKRCLAYEHFEQVMFFLQDYLPSLADKFVTQALNHRAGTWGLNVQEAMYHGWLNKGLDTPTLMTVIEEDKWLYNITNMYLNHTIMGPSMVCSTTACNVLRAGGVFNAINGELQCGEIDVWDFFSMNIFDKDRMNSGRPQKCIDADPDNYLCQVAGEWTFSYQTDVNMRPLVANISNYCTTGNPHPYNRTGCF